ncbi:MAG: hypothetical protein U9R79_06150 [Armatimonadota bacterium]|nr:hypothetical protein [Armatimonadota bacterium]
MPTIRSERWADEQVWLGDGLVRFDADGNAVGVIKRAGQQISPPEPVGPSQVDAARQSASYTVDEAADEAPPERLPDEDQAPAEPATAAELAEANIDLDDASRQELYHYAVEELGLEIDWQHATKEALRQAIEEALTG